MTMYVNSHCLYDGTLYGSLTFFFQETESFLLDQLRFASGKGGFPSNKQQNKRTLLNNATYLYLQLDRRAKRNANNVEKTHSKGNAD